MSKSYWLMKTEPDAYGWDDLIAEGEGTWDGVRNHRAASNLRAMQVGDEAFFYHSNIGKEIVGVMRVSQAGLTDASDRGQVGFGEGHSGEEAAAAGHAQGDEGRSQTGGHAGGKALAPVRGGRHAGGVGLCPQACRMLIGTSEPLGSFVTQWQISADPT
jgi:hypothetical protein